jgi:hypothetical protein
MQNHLSICLHGFSDEVENQIKNWYEHILRIDENRFSKIPEGHNTRTKAMWKDEFP